MKYTSLSSRRSRAPSAVLAMMGMVTGPSALVSQEKHIDPSSAAPAPPVASADVITLPDGKPVKTKLTKTVSTEIVKVGDNLELAVAETVRQDGLVIIPRGAVLSAKVTSVRHARRGSRNGSVSFSVEKAVLPGGEVVALRPTAPVIAGRTVQDNLKAMGHLAVDPEFPPGGGIVLLAVAGPLMLFAKGHESVFYAGQNITLYVRGPLYLKREAVLQMQPPPYKGPAQVFYKNRNYIREANTHKAFYCGRKYLGQVRADETLQLELNPGVYWLSAGKDGKEKVRLEVQADHQYYIERDGAGLFITNLDDNPRLLDDGPLPNNLDFTLASPEVTADLLAIPLG